MSKPKIAIVVGSTRAARFADVPTQWIAKIAKAHADIDVEIVDLRDWPLPFFDEVASSAWAPSQNEVAQRWQKKVAEFDGFIFTAAEYNHAPTGVLKNAIDYAANEWNKKPAGFVGYGS
ncbi:MAG: NAD(P)H-dependent oxidoreductase, partial [Mesorhizobium sp.]